jgi:hypothetical protein
MTEGGGMTGGAPGVVREESSYGSRSVCMGAYKVAREIARIERDSTSSFRAVTLNARVLQRHATFVAPP